MRRRVSLLANYEHSPREVNLKKKDGDFRLRTGNSRNTRTIGIVYLLSRTSRILSFVVFVELENSETSASYDSLKLLAHSRLASQVTKKEQEQCIVIRIQRIVLC